MKRKLFRPAAKWCCPTGPFFAPGNKRRRWWRWRPRKPSTERSAVAAAQESARELLRRLLRSTRRAHTDPPADFATEPGSLFPKLKARRRQASPELFLEAECRKQLSDIPKAIEFRGPQSNGPGSPQDPRLKSAPRRLS